MAPTPGESSFPCRATSAASPTPPRAAPFLLWIPDVEKAVESCEKTIPKIAPHLSVSPAIKSYRPEFEGCRKILREEWDLIVAQHALQAAQSKETRHAQG